MPNPPRARASALLLAVVATSVIALVAPTLSTPAVAAPSPSRVGTTHAKKQAPAAHWTRATRAKHALARAKKAFAAETPAGERPDATLALRNLWLLKDSLPAADRRAANKLYQRPKLSGDCPPKRCSGVPALLGDENVLMHYDPTELAYDPNVAFANVKYVADTYANSGYRRPKSDGTRGGDGRVDIYVAQLEPGLYGYCTTDQKKLVKPGHFDVWAYCVLDADYVGFPRTPLENFQVTIAHEYYHATQFAYDIADDPWFQEATAAWVEDEMYPTINDNYQYLKDSPITHPGKPMDTFKNGAVFHYGVWSFFRYLTEHYPAKTGSLPTLLLDMWKNADSSKGPRKDRYSTQAINKALKKDAHTSLTKQFANFSAATRAPAFTFLEGATLGYPGKPLAGSASLPAGKRKSFKSKLDHLTSSTFQVTPGGGTSKLKVTVKMARKQTSPSAVVAIYSTSGLSFVTLKLNKKGVGKKTVVFDGTVGAVEVTLVNASTRYRDCYRRSTPYSCSGRPVDNNLKARVQVKAS
ncbi:MXAN_6640 family putative metalloprotease [Nocardioides halotolerans]|uniref:MXAN_6640 family putative metalloprotease n=1 Tax=Nocardioides halotolerans TaxID=433660 RepID=UPI0004010105|nr:MXAN_6640 family putative metalloprotease [Nocardioides halotolerans]